MAEASPSTSGPTTAGGELDSAARAQEIKNLDPGKRDDIARLAAIAREAGENRTRQAAMAKIQDLQTLANLRTEPDLAEVASTQLFGILAGTTASSLDDKERFSFIRKLDPADAVQVGMLTRHKPTSDTVLSCLQSSQDLLTLAEQAKSVHTRKAAATALDDIALLETLLDKLEGKEKTVSKAIAARLETLASELTTDAAPVISSKTESISENDKADPAETSTLQQGLETLQAELANLGTKNTAQLTAAKRKLTRLKKSLSQFPEQLEELVHATEQLLQEKLRLNNHYQEQIRTNTEELLKTLELAMAEGRSDDALPAWDKIQGNISNTGGAVRAGLKKLANVHKGTLTELRDWKIFASTERKKTLITQMQQLVDTKMHAADRSRRISAMHSEWKSLGRSNDNEELWLEFKKHSDAAYAPCKEYFTQRKKVMAENLKQRRIICDQVEQSLADLDPDNIIINDLNKLIATADKDWKQYAPVEQSKIKNLQKRYYGTLNKLRKIRKAALKGNGDAKQQCIARAEALTEIEDQQKAMAEARELQQQWKTIGPTTFKEDKAYWEQFRAACDKIFEARNQQHAARQEDLEKAEQQLRTILSSLEQIAAMKEDEALREKRNEFQDLANQFSAAFDPRLRKQGKALQDRFNKIHRQIESRFKQLPDKKQLQLANQLDAAVSLLESWEQPLLNCKDQAEYSASQETVDKSQWEQLELPAEADLQAALEQRLDTLAKGVTQEQFLSTASKAAEELRKLCIELEIRAGVDSPESDQQQRMQIQLEQLQQGFGQARRDNESPRKYALRTELRARAIGPVASSIRQTLITRMQQASRKLL
ncbi:MAG: DUF349 domain-containing protein [Gammaproteobacteria bacterium]